MHGPHSRSVPLLLPLLALLLAGSGCLCTDPVTGDSYFCFGEITLEEEAQLGAQYKPVFLAQSGGRYPDKELYAYLNGIVVGKMAPISHRPSVPWEFEILNTSQLNAFALPGGKVFVTRGLLAQVETEAQFAHLMGHEIGHVAHRHSMRGQGRNAVLGILIGTIGAIEQATYASDPDQPAFVAGTIGALGSFAFMKFGRDQELESDERGVDYAVAVGYDPREATRTFELFLRMKEEAGQSESYISGLLSTHPLDSTRIERIGEYIEEKYPDVASGKRTGLTVNRARWTVLRDRIRRAQKTYDRYDEAMAAVAAAQEEQSRTALPAALQLLNQAVTELPDHAAIRVGRAIVRSELGDAASALGDLDDAVRLQEDHFQARLLRGALRAKAGRFEEGISDLRRAEGLFEAHPMPPYYLGQAHDGLGRKEDARAAYERCLKKAPENSEVHQRAEERLEALNAGE